MNKYWLWFRLLIANQPCLCLFGLFVAASFAIPAAWLCTFVLVCRAAAAAGASDYSGQLGILVAYSAACAAAWLCIFGTCCGLIWAANVPGHGCDGDPYDVDARRRRRAAWLASRRETVEYHDGGVTTTGYGMPIAQPLEEDTVADSGSLDLVEKLKWAYLVLAIIGGVVAFLGIMPLLLVRTSSYVAAYAWGFASVGAYVAAAIAIYCLPFIAYGLCMAVRALSNYIAGTYTDASAVADKFAPV